MKIEFDGSFAREGANPMTPQETARRSAAAKILAAWDGEPPEQSATLSVELYPDDAAAMLTTALRETGADEMAEVLVKCHEHMHQLCAIVPGNDSAYQANIDLMAEARAVIGRHRLLAGRQCVLMPVEMTEGTINAATAAFKATPRSKPIRDAIRNSCAAVLHTHDITPKAPEPEIRRNTDGTLDEIVAHNTTFHLEQMDDNIWWMGITSGGNDINVWLSARGKIKATVEVTDQDTGIISLTPPSTNAKLQELK